MSSKNVLTGAKTFFPEVEFVPFEGKDSDNPFAFISQIAHNGTKKGWKKIRWSYSPTS